MHPCTDTMSNNREIIQINSVRVYSDFSKTVVMQVSQMIHKLTYTPKLLSTEILLIALQILQRTVEWIHAIMQKC